MSSPAKPLHDLKVLVVEDDYLQASLSAMVLEESGADVLGPVPDVQDARDLLDLIAPDCVLLDLRLRDDFAFLLAEELRRRGIPTVLATGYDPAVFPFNPPAQRLEKPFSDGELVEAVMIAVHRSGPASARRALVSYLQPRLGKSAPRLRRACDSLGRKHPPRSAHVVGNAQARKSFAGQRRDRRRRRARRRRPAPPA